MLLGVINNFFYILVLPRALQPTIGGGLMSQPHFEGSVRSPLTLQKMGLGSPLGLLKTQSVIAGVKTPSLSRSFQHAPFTPL